MREDSVLKRLWWRLWLAGFVMGALNIALRLALGVGWSAYLFVFVLNAGVMAFALGIAFALWRMGKPGGEPGREEKK